MEILYIINSLGKGGAEKVVVTLSVHMVNRGHKVSVLKLTDLDDEKTYIEELQQNGVMIYTLGSLNPRNIQNLRTLNRYLKSNRFGIIHTHLFPALYWSSLTALFNSRLRNQSILIYTEHSNENKRRKYPLIRFLEKSIYSRFHQIIAITQEVKHNLSSWLNNDNKISVIENGVDIEKIMGSPVIAKNKLCEMFKVSHGSVFLLMAASFRYPKDQKTLINACKLLGDKYHILLAGEGPNKATLLEYSKDFGLSGQIHFLGFRNDVASLMKSVDLNILSSEYEGMSGVTLEALASGKPFLGSDVPGINDIVPDKRFLFPKGNAEVLSEKITQIMNDNLMHENMVVTALQHVLQFDITNMANKHETLYYSLAQKQNN